jgi:hypothetical protein
LCPNSPSDPTANEFFCPSSPLMLTATNVGQNSATGLVPFEITNLDDRVQSYYADKTIGGPAASNASLGMYFDWGLPFFYGKSVYTAIDGMMAGGTVGPYYAY